LSIPIVFFNGRNKSQHLDEAMAALTYGATGE